MNRLKRIAARLPSSWQVELKRLHYGGQIKKGSFLTDEPEYKILQQFIRPGDWVIDIGANVGHYTKKFSELVGERGRVLAFEPVPTTFSLLSANVQKFEHLNVSLFNAGVSDKLSLAGISIPSFATGLDNFYQAHISDSTSSDLEVLTMPLDTLMLSQKIALVKIDAEGHEAFVLKGMRKLIEHSHPVLIVETGSTEVVEELCALGYDEERLDSSPNILFRPTAKV